MTKAEEEAFEELATQMRLDDCQRQAFREFIEEVSEKAFTRGQNNILE